MREQTSFKVSINKGPVQVVTINSDSYVNAVYVALYTFDYELYRGTNGYCTDIEIWYANRNKDQTLRRFGEDDNGKVHYL